MTHIIMRQWALGAQYAMTHICVNGLKRVNRSRAAKGREVESTTVFWVCNVMSQ